jgi:uncharacterized protein YktA (UPF0223 family)
VREIEYDIDYSLFTVPDTIIIVRFFNTIIDTKTKKINKELLLERYNEYRTVLNNKSLEKKYDKMLQSKADISIYKTMKNILESR